MNELFKNAEFIISISEGIQLPNNNFKIVTVCDNLIIINDNGNKIEKEDSVVANSIKQLVLSHIDKIKLYNDMVRSGQVGIFKSSYRADMSIKTDNTNYTVLGRGDNEEIKNFYTDLKNKVYALIK